MALLAIAAALSAPRMASFFRGRSLDQEGRRLLSLTHYGRSRAVAEGVPVLLWVNAADATYGLEIQTGYVDTDDRALTFTLDRDLTIETAESDAPLPYEDEGLPAAAEEGILFMPDGLVDDSSVSKIVIRQGEDYVLALVATPGGLDYELLPDDALPARN